MKNNIHTTEIVCKFEKKRDDCLNGTKALRGYHHFYDSNIIMIMNIGETYNNLFVGLVLSTTEELRRYL